ncbi:TPM domain-containing protein [Candidatus Poribacteria bacterium]|nr:TPM domain-containing protein [Candidatus Poribacteria bacterium]
MVERFRLGGDDRKKLRLAIADFERRTSAEMKVSILNRAKGDPWEAAVGEFARLGLSKTKQRNAVLVCVMPRIRKVVVLGDEGIHNAVSDGTWDRIVELVLNEFRQGRYFDGLANAIREVGGLLATHFPHQADDVDEIPDDIVVGDDDTTDPPDAKT